MRSLFPCSSCGEPNFWMAYSKSKEADRMMEAGECFTCAFWEVRTRQPNPLVIDNYVYSVGPEPRPNSNKSDLGMGGRRFDIELFDGRRFTTHNLWGGGEIPEKYRDRIPNTARFVGAERAQVGETTCWNSSPSNAPRYPTYKDVGGV